MAPRAVIFDIDGTLIDSNAVHVEAWREAFAAHGYAVPAERIRKQVGKGGDHLVPDILGAAADRKDGDAVRRDHGRLFLAMAAKRPLGVFPGVRELLEALRQRGVRVALATSSKEKELEAVEKSSGLPLRSLVDVSVTSDEADASKPAPDVVVAAVRKLDVPAERCLLVGDTVYDGAATRKAGVAFVGLVCGGRFGEAELRAAGARAVWRDPADLLSHLDAAVGG